MATKTNPGEAISTIDGKDISGAAWRCKAYSGGNPDKTFPGWKSCDYDDSTWGPNVVCIAIYSEIESCALNS